MAKHATPSEPVAEPRDLTVEVIIGDKPTYYRVSHEKSGLCFEAPTAREAVDAINGALSNS